MPIHNMDARARKTSLNIVVTRGATGKEENFGLVSYYHRNPVINWIVNKYINIKRRVKG